MIAILDVADIISENTRLTGIKCDPKRREAVSGCYSSFIYYETAEEQIASIITSLVKDHFFVDGNKRTALSTYIVLAQVNNIEFIKDTQQQVKVFVEIATSNKTIAEYAKMLFPKSTWIQG